MMVMVGYPDFLLKPEAVDKEYEVGHPLALPCLTGWASVPWSRPPGRPTLTEEEEPRPSAVGPWEDMGPAQHRSGQTPRLPLSAAHPPCSLRSMRRPISRTS